MPFHHHNQQNQQKDFHQPGAVSGLFQAAQALGSIGAPTGNLRTATSGTTTAGTDVLLSHNSTSTAQHQGFESAPPAPQNYSGLPPPPASAQQHGQQGQQYQQLPTPTTNYSLFETLQRQPQLPQVGLTPDHLESMQNMSGQHQQHTYSSPTDYSGSAPNISLQQATPQGPSSYSTQPTPNPMPGSLQPGPGGRPPPPQSAYTAPNTVPTIPHLNTNAQQYSLPTRSNTMNASHSYSRSSPAGLEQKYIPFNNNPEGQKYPTTPQQQPKFFSPQTPTGGPANSPLVLEQIRPRTNSNLNDDGMTGTALFNDGHMERQPTNSNYMSPWAMFAFDWCKYPVPHGNSAGKMAVGSYLEDTHNFITILDTQIVPQEHQAPGAPGYGLEYTRIAEATCAYPVTRILWEPPISQKQSTDLLATSGDHLRLWSLPNSTAPAVSNTITRSSSVNTREPAPAKLTPLALLSNSKTPEHTAPLTSLDWNTLSPKLIITSSIDTTCTIWDIPTLTAKTQLIAHDKEVFDVRFCAGSIDVFVSCGADGSVRMFDLRSLEHSTIIYEPAEKQPDKEKGSTPPQPRMSPTRAQQTLHPSPPLLRLAASPHDSHLLATFAADSSLIRILDVRQPGQALLELRGHAASVNAIEWSPSRRGMLASGGDDSLVLVWDLLHSNNGAVVPNGGESSLPTPPTQSVPATNTAGQPNQAAQAVSANIKGPAASWKCEYEVGNLSWAPPSGLTAQGGEWVGVAGGRGVWGVKL